MCRHHLTTYRQLTKVGNQGLCLKVLVHCIEKNGFYWREWRNEGMGLNHKNRRPKMAESTEYETLRPIKYEHKSFLSGASNMKYEKKLILKKMKYERKKTFCDFWVWNTKISTDKKHNYFGFYYPNTIAVLKKYCNYFIVKNVTILLQCIFWLLWNTGSLMLQSYPIMMAHGPGALIKSSPLHQYKHERISVLEHIPIAPQRIWRHGSELLVL